MSRTVFLSSLILTVAHASPIGRDIANQTMVYSFDNVCSFADTRLTPTKQHR